MMGIQGVLGATLVLACFPAAAQEAPAPRIGPEVAIGGFAHGVDIEKSPPPNTIYEGTEERGTVDVQLVYRTVPLGFALKPRLTAKLQLNTDGRTSFASVGAEWRQHILRGRVYGQIGIGLSVHDGYRNTPDPFAPDLSRAEALRRYDLYLRRTSFGSSVVFNPNLSIGVRLNDRWATEVAWEHFSHRQIFARQNPGFESFGLRLVRRLGRR